MFRTDGQSYDILRNMRNRGEILKYSDYRLLRSVTSSGDSMALRAAVWAIGALESVTGVV